uniref:hypothetical protein n=1 Tax=Sulfurovum sp. TaxID=1969726 RepID=UPI003568EA32
MKKHTFIVTIIIFLFGVAGCGTTGKTQRSTVSLNDVPKVSHYPKINVFPIEVDSKGIILINVGIKEYGKFDEADKENIVWSLRDTLKNETHKKNFTTSKRFNVHIFLHKYIVAGDNNSGAVWAAVDWCIADEKNNILFSETFYATKTTRFVGTIGG